MFRFRVTESFQSNIILKHIDLCHEYVIALWFAIGEILSW